MIAVPLDVDGVTARYDPSENSWRIGGAGDDHVLREWTWGERHRLIAACTRDGRLDPRALIAGLVALLLTPEPVEELRDLYAYVSLRLLGVPDDHRPMALVDAEWLLAERFGWRPEDFDAEPAGAIDRLLHRLTGAAKQLSEQGQGQEQGWTTIRLDDTPAEGASG